MQQQLRCHPFPRRFPLYSLGPSCLLDLALDIDDVCRWKEGVEQHHLANRSAHFSQLRPHLERNQPARTKSGKKNWPLWIGFEQLPSIHSRDLLDPRIASSAADSRKFEYMQFLARIKRLPEGRLGKDEAFTAGHDEDGRTGPLHSGRLRAFRMSPSPPAKQRSAAGSCDQKEPKPENRFWFVRKSTYSGFRRAGESPPRSKKSSLAPIRSMSKVSANRPTIKVSRSPFGASKGVAAPSCRV